MQTDGRQIYVEDCGVVKLNVQSTDNEIAEITLRECAFCPEAQQNLIATKRIVQNGGEVLLKKHGCSIYDPAFMTQERNVFYYLRNVNGTEYYSSQPECQHKNGEYR